MGDDRDRACTRHQAVGMNGGGVTAAGRLVGQRVPRKEDPRLLTGRGRYVDDITVPGLLHAHFLRPVQGGQEIVFRSDVVKAGRSFNLHRVTASQDGKPVITMTYSFTADTDGYEYDLSGIPDGVPAADNEDRPSRLN